MHPIGQSCIYVWAVATVVAFVSAIVFLVRLITKKNQKTAKRVFWIATAVAIGSFLLYGITSPVTRCKHEFTTVIDQRPTCTVDGKTEQHCPLCDFTKKGTIKATGHNMVTESKREPTYEANGELVEKCSICGYEVITNIDMLIRETIPVTTNPVEAKPAETKPTETEPTETKPAETESAQTKPVETAPTETEKDGTESIEETESEDNSPGFEIFWNQKTQWRKFAGEYRVVSGRTEGLPNVIHFNDDGTGYYYVYQHMYIFDYKVSKNVVLIETHEDFMPIYHGELNVRCTRTGDSFTILDATYQKHED